MATIRMPEHQPEQHGDIGEDYNILTLAAVAVVGLLTLVLSVIWLKAIYARADRWEWEQKVVKAQFGERQQLRDAQEMRLQTYGWSDPAHNKVSVPVGTIEGTVLGQLRSAQLQEDSVPAPAGARLTLNPAATPNIAPATAMSPTTKAPVAKPADSTGKLAGERGKPAVPTKPLAGKKPLPAKPGAAGTPPAKGTAK